MYGGGTPHENGIHHRPGEYKIEGEVGNPVNAGAYRHLLDDPHYRKDRGTVSLATENVFGYFTLKGRTSECFKATHNFSIKKHATRPYSEFKGVGHLGVSSGTVSSDWTIGFHIPSKVACFNVGLRFTNASFTYKIICRFLVEEEC